MRKSISIIVAIADNNAIGKDNKLLTYIPGDLKRFKELTSGHTVIMGRRTFESLPHGPLPQRVNIVITHDPGLSIEGCQMAHSVEEALNLCQSQDENFIIGGETLYRAFLPFADKLYITRIFKSFEADTFFPEIRDCEWAEIHREDFSETPKNDFKFSFIIYQRKK